MTELSLLAANSVNAIGDRKDVQFDGEDFRSLLTSPDNLHGVSDDETHLLRRRRRRRPRRQIHGIFLFHVRSVSTSVHCAHAFSRSIGIMMNYIYTTNEGVGLKSVVEALEAFI